MNDENVIICPYAQEFCDHDQCPNRRWDSFNIKNEDFECVCLCSCDADQQEQCALDI